MSDQNPDYQVGDVVNGHRWNGTTWEPVADSTPPAPPSTKPWYKKWWGITLIVLGVLIVIGIFLPGGDDTTSTPVPEESTVQEEIATEQPKDEETPAEPTEEATTEEAAPPAEDSAAGVGEPVRDGKFEFTVTDVKTDVSRVGDQYLNQKAQGSYTLVTLKVENIGDEPQLFDDSNVSGTDSKGREVSSDGEAGFYANEDNEAFLNEINPGNSVQAVVVFDLPKGEKLVLLDVKDSAFSGGAEISLE